MWEEVSRALDQSVTRVITRIATLLPGFIALLLALLVAALVAWVVGLIVRRALRGIDFDAKAASWGLAPGRAPTDIAVRVLTWGILFVGFLVGATAFEATLASRLVDELFRYLPSLLAAGVVLAIGAITARFLARAVLIGAVNLNVQYAYLLSIGMKWLVMVLTVAMALDHLGIGGKIVDEAFAILFGGIVLTLALAIGLGARELVSRSLEQASRRPEEHAEPFRHF